ncbi:MAG: SAM-dependent methyltransferase [Dehalococcoidia bacterium]|nr:SAM-dependent methyltransferase [Dehalococcoidia bacterium]
MGQGRKPPGVPAGAHGEARGDRAVQPRPHRGVPGCRSGAPEKPETLTLASGRRYGILATRSQLRPNHLGVSVATIVGHDGATVLVRGLDAIDGTPILDIKPYLPEYDSVPDARIPGD